MQLRDEKKHSIRYESELWFETKQKYNVTKRECREVLKTLKKVRYYLYNCKFILKIDARVLIAQLNRSSTNLSSALITRWIAWIRFFDFDVRHVSEAKHTAIDDLFRKLSSSANIAEIEAEEDINDWIEAQMNCVRIYSITDAKSLLEISYSEKSQNIAAYLTILRKSSNMTAKKFNIFKKKALKYKVQNKHLFRRNNKNVSLKRVINDSEERFRIIQQLHDESDHREREETYKRIIDRY
jgi:hypothetical protein